ncbi:DNA cytosine methyltransferase [Enterococcus casseliflavus]|uniref:DNA cytosine methyltransferase n=1 Tax=Enterococcus casseliflavus TaxID=37734 RepID=UPI003D6BDF43
MTYTVVDFFCGAGGFSEGFHQAGFEIIKAFDIWSPAILTHNRNHPSSKPIAEYGNVEEIAYMPDLKFEETVPDSDVIIGSPPCVAFSNSNKSGKADKTQGIKLLKSYLRIIARKQFKKNSILKYWVLENVTNIQKYIKPSYTMSDLGLPGDEVLEVKYQGSGVYEMKFFGVPSNRKRYICGNFPSPQKICNDTNFITLERVLLSLGFPKEKINRKVQDINFNFSILGKNLTDHHYIKEIAPFEWKKAKRQKQDKGYMGRMSFPEDRNKPARTIMATMSGSSRESFILSLGEERYRYPTIREVATIMSFPIDYRFYGDSDAVKYKLVGNAVPPKFSYAIAKAIIEDSSEEERMTKARRKRFKVDDGFVNLNYMKFPLNTEKKKKKYAGYKYHVPYLKINTYRAELQNYFIDGKVKWKTEIHKSQGEAMKVFKNLNDCLDFLNYESQMIIENFVTKYIMLIKTQDNLQETYRLTTEQRSKENLVGPDELLNEIRGLVDKYFNNVEGDRSVHLDGIEYKIPYKIIICYVVLARIIESLG